MIYDVSPRNEPHRDAVRNLNQLLTRGLGLEYVVRIVDAVAVGGKDAPEVDVAVLVEIYHPGPTAADALARILVSDTTYATDRNYKVPIYVAAGVPSYIVNIPLRQVEFSGLLSDLEAEHGRMLTERDALAIPGVAIPVATLFSD